MADKDDETDDEIGLLQEGVLASVLDGAVLPGMDGPVRLADIEMVLGRPEVPLDPADYRGSPEPAVGRAVKLRDPEDPPAGYLRFGVADTAPDRVSVRLSVVDRLGNDLSTVTVPFAKEAGGSWTVPEPPASLSV